MSLTKDVWLVCGGRDYANRSTLFRELDRIAGERGSYPTRLVHGNARGADRLAGEWAKGLPYNIQVIAVAADWKANGRAAGPLRNQRMLHEQRPNVVIAFPGGRGTADMVNRARQQNYQVIEVRP